MSRIKNKIANKRIKKDAGARVEVFRDLKNQHLIFFIWNSVYCLCQHEFYQTDF